MHTWYSGRFPGLHALVRSSELARAFRQISAIPPPNSKTRFVTAERVGHNIYMCVRVCVYIYTYIYIYMCMYIDIYSAFRLISAIPPPTSKTRFLTAERVRYIYVYIYIYIYL